MFLYAANINFSSKYQKLYLLYLGLNSLVAVAVFFGYLVKITCTRLHWTSHFTRNTRPCLIGPPVRARFVVCLLK